MTCCCYSDRYHFPQSPWLLTFRILQDFCLKEVFIISRSWKHRFPASAHNWRQILHPSFNGHFDL